jgi:Protein of unknown function (DUF2721)
LLWQSSFLGNNPFGVLTAVVAPAILTNASAVLALGTSNRLGWVVDRTRVVFADLAATDPGSEEYHNWTAQLGALRVRTQMLLRDSQCFMRRSACLRLRRWFLWVARLPPFTEGDCYSRLLRGSLSQPERPRWSVSRSDAR